MRDTTKIQIMIAGIAIAMGFFLTQARKSTPSPSRIPTSLRTLKLEVAHRDEKGGILFSPSEEGTPGFWIKSRRGKGLVNGGIHPNGFPFLLVSDAEIKNFALGRQEGRNRSPILVFRSADIVKMVLGLHMTESGSPPFLAHWSAAGKRSEFIGKYCDHPGRICSQ